MAYNPRPNSGDRDKAYPSEIAADRPALATRIQCQEDYQTMSPQNSIRGREPEEPMFAAPEPPARESMCERFNRQLREGIGTSYPDNTDE